MKDRMDFADAYQRHNESVAALRKATDRLIGMCKLTLLDVESIQDQACVVAGLVCSEHDTRVQLEEVERAERREASHESL
jgi:hypothetical protein